MITVIHEGDTGTTSHSVVKSREGNLAGGRGSGGSLFSQLIPTTLTLSLTPSLPHSLVHLRMYSLPPSFTHSHALTPDQMVKTERPKCGPEMACCGQPWSSLVCQTCSPRTHM